MGWWDNVKEWGTALYNNAAVMQRARDAGSFTYHTALNTVELLTIAPIKASYKVIFNESSRRVVSHVARIVGVDMLPAIIASYTMAMIRRQTEDYQEENPDAAFLSTYLALQAGIALLGVANAIYQHRERIKTTVRMGVVTLESGSAFNELNANQMTLCAEQKCNLQRRLQGSMRDLVSFFLTEGAISLVEMAPWGGGSLAAVLKVYHRGGYIMSLVVPLCNRHLVTYKIENPELVVALGLSQATLSLVASQVLEFTTGVPATYYQSFVTQITLLMSIASATQMRLPAPVVESKRPMRDPVVVFQSGIGIVFDTFAKGTKQQIPQLLKFFKQPPSDIPWGAVFSYGERVWEHPYARLIEFIFLPHLVRSSEGFKKDTIIAPNWDEYRLTIIGVISAIEDIKRDYFVAVKLATWDPKKAAKALNKLFGLNKPLTELLINLIGNRDFMARLSDARRQLEAMTASDAPLINRTPNALQSRNSSMSIKGENQGANEYVSGVGLAPARPVSEVVRQMPQASSPSLSARKVVAISQASSLAMPVSEVVQSSSQTPPSALLLGDDASSSLQEPSAPGLTDEDVRSKPASAVKKRPSGKLNSHDVIRGTMFSLPANENKPRLNPRRVIQAENVIQRSSNQ
jgi:hypothetical protein